MTKICGIYQIRNKVNNKKYDGKSINIKSRWNKHKSDLKNNRGSPHLQSAWNKYEEKNFEFVIIRECPKEELKYWEEYQINLDESWNREKGYNIRNISEGVESHSEETKKKMRENHVDYSGKNHPSYGVKRSKETILKISGENNSTSKLTQQQVDEIREKYIPKLYTQEMLAIEYNVSRALISLIINYKIWKDGSHYELTDSSVDFSSYISKSGSDTED